MRLFLAIPLPEAVRREASALLRTLSLDRSTWRLVRSEAWHLTLRFLGEVGEGSLPRHDAAWRRVVSGFGPIPLAVGGWGFFPEGRRARILWLAVHDRSPDGALGVLASGLETEARAAGFAPELRPFAPHVTLARARRPADAPVLAADAHREVGRFVAAEVVLFRSVTSPAGAYYEERARYPLEGA